MIIYARSTRWLSDEIKAVHTNMSQAADMIDMKYKVQEIT